MLDVSKRIELEPLTVKQKRYSVKEVFGPTMQGEFLMAGRLTLFLRMHYCDGDGLGHWCSWCDTKETWDKTYPGYDKMERLTADEIHDALFKRTLAYHGHNANLVSSEQSKLKRMWCTISGGNPLMQLDDALIDRLRQTYRLQIETQGTIYKECVEKCDMVVVSPKPPSSGLVDLTKEQIQPWVQLYYQGVKVGFKIVVFDDTDFDWANMLYEYVRDTLHVHQIEFGLQAGTSQDGDVTEVVLDKYRWLVEKWLASGMMSDAVVLPQVHTLVWGRRKGV